MKRIIGIFFVSLMCLILGLCVQQFRDAKTSLVGNFDFDIGGMYD